MYALMDHEDIGKSRKALLATSVLLLILHSFQIAGQTINIFGLEAKFDKELSLGLCGLAVVYFLYVFIMRVAESKFLETIESRITQHKTKLEDIGSRLDSGDFIKDDVRIIPPGVEFRDYKTWVDSINAKLDLAFKTLKTITFLLVDVGPPLLFAVFSLKKTHALTQVYKLLSLG